MNLLEKRLQKKYPNENFQVLTYTKMKDNAQVQCLTCNTIYNNRAENYLRKNKVCFCLSCGMAEFEKQKYQEKINQKFPLENIQIIDYHGVKGKLKVKCLKCLNEYEFEYGQNILLTQKQRVCEHCFPNKRDAMQNTIAKFKQFMQNTDLFIDFILPTEIHSHTVIESTCTLCNSKNYKTIYDYLRGRGCSCQGNNIKLTENEYSQRLGCGYKLLSEYNGLDSTVLIQHLDCGFIYKAPARHVSCPKCRGSNGEKEVRYWLKEHNFNFIEQYQMNIQGHKLVFDFYLPEQDLYIEYQGEQHFKPIDFFGGEEQFKKQQLYDNYKRQTVGDKLFEISFSENVSIKLNEYMTKKSNSLVENFLET